MTSVCNMMRILLGLRCPVVINEKLFSLLEGRGAEVMYVISSYFFCGTFGIWKKACPFISGTKGRVQGRVDLEVTHHRVFLS